MSDLSLHMAFREHESDLITFMTARLKCSFTARDLAQELYVKISTLESPSDIVNAKAYIFRMAANLVTDHQRREQRQRSLLDEVDSIIWSRSASPTPEQEAIAKEDLRAMLRVVEQMTPTTRSIFKRNRFDGQTQRDIAEELGISQTAVEKHIRKALKLLSAQRKEV
ncbi:RNA polymerase sigma factor [Rhodovibrionaceae bacterium A322]